MKKINHKITRKKCLISNSRKIRRILDLGDHPFADTFIKKNDLKKKEPILPLKILLCKSSGCIQTETKTSPLKRYNLYDYSYTSSNSSFSRKHWDNFSLEIIKELQPNNNDKIFEVGSNDGYLLKNFKKKGFVILGIDASKYMSRIANKNKIKTECCIFNFNNSNKIKKKFGNCNILIANNVLNHSNEPNEFIKGVYNILDENGTFVFELPYWLDTIKSKKFDQIYHEHVTYFSKMAFNLLKKHNFEIKKIKKVNYHGGSIRVYAQKEPQPKKIKLVKTLIREEENFGLFKIKTYEKLSHFIESKKKKIINKIKILKRKGNIVIGIGAAAKANTFLNTFEITNKLLDFITENSIYKIGKFTPKSRIPILHDNEIIEYKKIYAIVLSWNIAKTLKLKLKKLNKKIVFLSF